MSNITLPMELMLRDILPSRSEQLLSGLRFLKRESFPQSVKGLLSRGFDPELCADLIAFKATRGLDMPLMIALFIDELFKTASTDYAAKASFNKYLKRRARTVDVDALRNETSVIINAHFSGLDKAWLGPLISTDMAQKHVPLY